MLSKAGFGLHRVPKPRPEPPAQLLRYGLSTGANPTDAVLDECAAIGAEYVRFDYSSHSATDIARVNRVHGNGQATLLVLPKRSPAGSGTTWATYWKTRIPLRMYEIMNEPDLNGYTAATYAPQAKQWCDEIRAADPDALIWLPGNFKGGDVAGKTPPDFCTAVINAGCSFDVWSGHYFDDDVTWNDPRNGWHYAATIRSLLNASGRQDVLIASSESHPFYNGDPTGQSNDVTRILTFAQDGPVFSANPGQLASVAVYRMDFFETGSFDSALMDSGGVRRPAWTTYHDFVVTAPPSGVYWAARIDSAFYITNYGLGGGAQDAPWCQNEANAGSWGLFETHAAKAVTAIHWGGSGVDLINYDSTAGTRTRNRNAFSSYSMGASSQQLQDLADNTNVRGALTKVDTWATTVAGQNFPVLLRPFWEMNGSWGYPWQVGQGTPDISTADYVAAWRTLHGRITAIASCVSFFWCPNITAGVPDPTPWFPGTAYVDWVGFDGYNTGGTESPSTLFNATLAIVTGLAPGKPVGIGETGCDAPTSYAGGKSQWITDFFAWLAIHPEVKLFSWFNEAFTNSPFTHIEVGNASTTFGGAAQTAFQTGIANSRYVNNIVNPTTFPSGQKVPIP